MSTAYVIQDHPELDFSPVLHHASSMLTVLPRGDITHFTETRTRRELETRLSTFRDEDYLVLTGDPELIALTLLILSKRISVVRLLKYDRFVKKYNVRTHTL